MPPFQKANKLGRRFRPGQSGNPGGRPKGSYSVLGMLIRALNAKSQEEAIKEFRAVLKGKKSSGVVKALEFAARVNKEIGANGGDGLAPVTIVFPPGIDPTKLGRRKDIT